MRAIKILSLVICASVLMLLAVRPWRLASNGEVAPSRPSSVDGPPVEGLRTVDHVASGEADGGDSPAVDARVGVSPWFHGSVSIDGVPASAMVQAVRRELVAESLAGWGILDLETILESRVVARSDGQGRFALDAPVGWDLGHGAEVSLSAAAEAANARAWGPLQGHGDALDLKLDAAAELVVHVVDEEGAPIPGAQVIALGRAKAGGSTGDWIVRDWLTVADGTSRIGRIPGEMVLLAQKGEARSKPMQGEPEERVTLVLRETFAARGTATLPHRGASGANARVTVRAEERHLDRVLGGAAPTADGSWRIEGLPVLPGRELVFRRDAPGALPQEVRMPCPGPGAEVVIDFPYQPGEEVAVRVVDPEGAPVEAATVELWWPRDESMRKWGLLTAATDGGGRATFLEAPRAQVWFRVRSSGCSYLASYGPWIVPRPDDGEVVIEVSRGGGLLVRCTSAGRPVANFTLTCELISNNDSVEIDVYDAEEGEVLVDGVALGRLRVFAASPELPQSEPQFVDVVADKPAHVVLDMPSPRYVRGRVVAAGSYEAVGGARVQALNVSGNRAGRAWGAVYATAADGSFEGVPVTTGRGAIEISGEWIAPKVVFVAPGVAPIVDVGTIVATEPRTLEIRLLDRTAREAEAFHVKMDGGNYVEYQPFGPGAVMHIPGLRAGRGRLMLEPPGVPPIFVHLDMPSGQEWYVEVPGPRGKELLVEVLPPSNEDCPQGLTITVWYRLPGGELAQNFAFVENDCNARLDWIYGKHASVVVDEWVEGVSRALVSTVVEEPAESLVRVQLDLGEQRRRIRLVHPQVGPLPGADVILTSVEAHSIAGWMDFDTTGPDGEVVLSGGDVGALMATVLDPTHGWMTDVGFPVQDEGEVTELVLDPASSVEIRLLDRDVPLSAVEVELEGAVSGVHARKAESDLAGWVRFPPVDPRSRVLARVERDDLWPVERVLDVGHAPRIELQVRRRGALEVQARAGAAAVSGAEVTLENEEHGVEVSEWLAQDEVRVEPDNGRTGADGRLSFSGMPNGWYRWRVTFPDGTEASGRVLVPPLGSATLSTE